MATSTTVYGTAVGLADLKVMVEACLLLTFQDRESSYRGGLYYLSGFPGSDELAIQANYIPYLQGYKLADWESYPTLLYVTCDLGRGESIHRKLLDAIPMLHPLYRDIVSSLSDVERQHWNGNSFLIK